MFLHVLGVYHQCSHHLCLRKYLDTTCSSHFSTQAHLWGWWKCLHQRAANADIEHHTWWRTTRESQVGYMSGFVSEISKLNPLK